MKEPKMSNKSLLSFAGLFVVVAAVLMLVCSCSSPVAPARLNNFTVSMTNVSSCHLLYVSRWSILQQDSTVLFLDAFLKTYGDTSFTIDKNTWIEIMSENDDPFYYRSDTFTVVSDTVIDCTKMNWKGRLADSLDIPQIDVYGW
jgi:hypothetical protein